MDKLQANTYTSVLCLIKGQRGGRGACKRGLLVETKKISYKATIQNKKSCWRTGINQNLNNSLPSSTQTG